MQLSPKIDLPLLDKKGCFVYTIMSRVTKYGNPYLADVIYECSHIKEMYLID